MPHLNPAPNVCDVLCEGLSSNRFTFLNATQTLANIDWNNTYVNALWNYHLHYFDFTLCCHADQRARNELERLVTSWIDGAKVGTSAGWNAYPISLRLVNWVYAFSRVHRQLEPSFARKLQASIQVQAEFLSAHLEFQLLANHLVKNVKALIVAGLFLTREDLLRQSETLIWRELKEQVLDDGGHYERSPMYHAQSLADFVECYALLKAFGRLNQDQEALFSSRLRRMAGFLQAMSHSDGTIALFNDSANTAATRPAPILASVEAVAGLPETVPVSFPDTGYFLRASDGGAEKIIVDAGPPSAEYNMAHAHCDMLSYELFLDGGPLVVDPGVHGYDADPFREYCRSTRAHNTVVFDRKEQSEVWGTFRMARRASILSGKAVSGKNDDEWMFEGSYSPYYDRDLVHSRRIERLSNREWANGEWVVTDKATKSGLPAVSFVHLHPSVSIRETKDATVECERNGKWFLLEPFGFEEVGVVEDVYFPDFGIVEYSWTICLTTVTTAGREFGYRIKRVPERPGGEAPFRTRPANPRVSK